MKKIILITAVLILTVSAIADRKKPKVVFRPPGDRTIDVMVGGKHFPATNYLFLTRLVKPVLHPVRTPSGIMVTRGYPLMKVEGESGGSPHHVGVYFTYGDVNGEDVWNNKAPEPEEATDLGAYGGVGAGGQELLVSNPPKIKHVKVTEMLSADGEGTLSTISHWINKAGEVVLQENRKMVFYIEDSQYAIDFSIDLIAQDKKVVFGDTKEGMFAIRVAEWLKEDNGTAEYLSSNGDKTEGNIWGKPAKWVRLQGEKDGKTAGIAIFNHPSSVNYPTNWHVRAYGLFAANPLGQGDFEKRRGIENPQWLNLTLKPGESAHFRFLMLVYDGPRTAEQVEKRFEQFAK